MSQTLLKILEDKHFNTPFFWVRYKKKLDKLCDTSSIPNEDLNKMHEELIHNGHYRASKKLEKYSGVSRNLNEDFIQEEFYRLMTNLGINYFPRKLAKYTRINPGKETMHRVHDFYISNAEKYGTPWLCKLYLSHYYESKWFIGPTPEMRVKRKEVSSRITSEWKRMTKEEKQRVYKQDLKMKRGVK